MRWCKNVGVFDFGQLYDVSLWERFANENQFGCVCLGSCLGVWTLSLSTTVRSGILTVAGYW